MTTQTEPATGNLERRLRTARLVSGLVLFTFVLLHFCNHMLALVSLQTAEAGRLVFIAIWRNPAGTLIFYTALLTHIILALVALYRRRTLVMPFREACQVVLGLAIPLLIAEHVIGTRLNTKLTGIQDTYEFVANTLWIWSPFAGARQVVAALAVWAHGCLGIYFWLRFRPGFARVAALLLVFATLIPALTVLGFVNAGRTVQEIPFAGFDSVDPATIEAATAIKTRVSNGVYVTYGSALLLVLLLRALRARRERRNIIEIRYPDGRIARVPRGYSVLEASRLAGIPHHAVCGGRGRCSTCRVVILEHLGELPPPQLAELATLSRIHAGPDIRLACQLRPTADLKVAPVLAAGEALSFGTPIPPAPGRERDVAVLFCDIRNFTSLANRRLPFDTVFLLNRYFAIVGRAVENAGGRMDKFIGDGAMAIFGLDASPEEASRQALHAAHAIVRNLEKVSEELAPELHAPLRVAIGIHAGPAIVGAMGYGRAMNVTVIGDTVNVASRLETLAKERDAAIVVSGRVASLSGEDLSGYEFTRVDIRGHPKPIEVYVIEMPSLALASASA